MAVESEHMADLNKMVAPKPADPLPPGKVRSPAPENFKGCECPTWRCKNRSCPCKAASYPCTSKCKCVGCVLEDTGSDSNTGAVTWCKCKVSRCSNKYCRCVKDSHRCSSKCECKDCWNSDGVRGTDEAVHTTPPANSEPEITEDDITNKPSSGIEPEQADTSSMASESRLMADPNNMAAHKPAASVLPRNVERPPKDFKGCQCLIVKCVKCTCHCFLNDYPCTSKCKCQGCMNTVGVRGSDSNTEPVWQGCKCTVSNCGNRRCPCMRRSFRCSSNCMCENCANRPGGRETDEAVHTTPPSNTEPEIFDDDTKNKLMELFTEITEDDINKFTEDNFNNKVTELSVEINNGGSDLNKLP